MRQITPYSTPGRLAKMDGRLREARMMRDTRAALIEHVGGKPSAVQRMLIDRAAVLMLQVSLMDAKQSDGGLTAHDGRQYLAWCNTLSRLLRQLGLKGAAGAPPSLRDHIAGRAAA